MQHNCVFQYTTPEKRRNEVHLWGNNRKNIFLGGNVGMRSGGVSASVNGSLSFNVAL